eukprot:scaffold598_cov318-Pavlova_lutheri.AAC.7
MRLIVIDGPFFVVVFVFLLVRSSRRRACIVGRCGRHASFQGIRDGLVQVPACTFRADGRRHDGHAVRPGIQDLAFDARTESEGGKHYPVALQLFQRLHVSHEPYSGTWLVQPACFPARPRSVQMQLCVGHGARKRIAHAPPQGSHQPGCGVRVGCMVPVSDGDKMPAFLKSGQVSQWHQLIVCTKERRGEQLLLGHTTRAFQKAFFCLGDHDGEIAPHDRGQFPLHGGVLCVGSCTKDLRHVRVSTCGHPLSVSTEPVDILCVQYAHGLRRNRLHVVRPGFFCIVSIEHDHVRCPLFEHGSVPLASIRQDACAFHVHGVQRLAGPCVGLGGARDGAAHPTLSQVFQHGTGPCAGGARLSVRPHVGEQQHVPRWSALVHGRWRRGPLDKASLRHSQWYRASTARASQPTAAARCWNVLVLSPHRRTSNRMRRSSCCVHVVTRPSTTIAASGPRGLEGSPTGPCGGNMEGSPSRTSTSTTRPVGLCQGSVPATVQGGAAGTMCADVVQEGWDGTACGNGRGTLGFASSDPCSARGRPMPTGAAGDRVIASWREAGTSGCISIDPAATGESWTCTEPDVPRCDWTSPDVQRCPAAPRSEVSNNVARIKAFLGVPFESWDACSSDPGRLNVWPCDASRQSMGRYCVSRCGRKVWMTSHFCP